MTIENVGKRFLQDSYFPHMMQTAARKILTPGGYNAYIRTNMDALYSILQPWIQEKYSIVEMNMKVTKKMNLSLFFSAFLGLLKDSTNWMGYVNFEELWLFRYNFECCISWKVTKEPLRCIIHCVTKWLLHIVPFETKLFLASSHATMTPFRFHSQSSHRSKFN